jgi:hypothetical protein
VRRQAQLGRLGATCSTGTEPLGERAIVLVGNGRELRGRHQQRPAEALRPPLIERALLEPGSHLEGVQARARWNWL